MPFLRTAGAAPCAAVVPAADVTPPVLAYAIEVEQANGARDGEDALRGVVAEGSGLVTSRPLDETTTRAEPCRRRLHRCPTLRRALASEYRRRSDGRAEAPDRPRLACALAHPAIVAAR